MSYRTQVLTFTFEVLSTGEYDKKGALVYEASLDSIEPRGVPTVKEGGLARLGCYCLQPTTIWEHIALDDDIIFDGSMCDACWAQQSIETVGVEEFLSGVEIDREGTLVVKGWLAVTSYTSYYDGDDYDEEFNVESFEWQPCEPMDSSEVEKLVDADGR